MRRIVLGALAVGLVAMVAVGVLVLWPFWKSPPEVTLAGDAARGAYVLRTGGCLTCHTRTEEGSPPLAGGRALQTPFGTIPSSNITPDPETGIGGWTTGAFVQAMTEGLSPGGWHYFPAFPYTSYTNMTVQDLADLKAHLDTVPPVRNAVPAPAMDFPFGFRPLLGGWKLLFFERGWWSPDPARSPVWNRGAYLVNGPGHCGECHTPRNAMGAMDRDRFLAGTRDGPDGKPVPNITPHPDGIAGWSKGDIVWALQTGLLPDGDALGGAMAEVIKDETSHLTQADLDAIAEFLLSVEPLPDGEGGDAAQEQDQAQLP